MAEFRCHDTMLRHAVHSAQVRTQAGVRAEQQSAGREGAGHAGVGALGVRAGLRECMLACAGQGLFFLC